MQQSSTFIIIKDVNLQGNIKDFYLNHEWINKFHLITNVTTLAQSELFGVLMYLILLDHLMPGVPTYIPKFIHT